jgi:hypothetical protein
VAEQEWWGCCMLVCGGRAYANRQMAEVLLGRLKPAKVIHGAAPGADRLSGEVAAQLGIPTEEWPADWALNCSC